MAASLLVHNCATLYIYRYINALLSTSGKLPPLSNITLGLSGKQHETKISGFGAG